MAEKNTEFIVSLFFIGLSLIYSKLQKCDYYLSTNLLFCYLLKKGVITKVYDGDTLTFVPDNKKHDEWKIRLAEIDCPESDQPCGKEATDFLKVF